MDVTNRGHYTTKTDLSLLLGCLKYQMKCPDSQKQALLTINSICQNREDNVDLFREMGGVEFVYKLFKSSVVHSDVKEVALFTLGTFTDSNVHCKHSLCRREMFSDLADCLMREDTPLTQRRVAVYLLSVLVGNNKLGQTLAQMTSCLDNLLYLFGSSFPLTTEATRKPTNITQTCQLWTSVCNALCGCINNPQNEEGQRICVSAFPLVKSWLQQITLARTELFQSICSFIAMAVSNNSYTQECFSASGGLETLTLSLVRLTSETDISLACCRLSVSLTKTLSVCITDNSALASGLAQHCVVPQLLSLLSSPNLDPRDRLSVMLTLGHLTDASEEHQVHLLQCGGLSTIISLLTEPQSEELRKVATFILQSCKQATMSLGVSAAGQKLGDVRATEPCVNMEDYWTSVKELQHRIDQLEERRAEEAEDKEAPLDPAPPAGEPVGVGVAREHLHPPPRHISPPNLSSAPLREAAADGEDRERAEERGRGGRGGGGGDDGTRAKRGEEECKNYGEQTTLLMSCDEGRGEFRRDVDREVKGGREECEDWRRESTPLLSVQKRRGAERNQTEETQHSAPHRMGLVRRKIFEECKQTMDSSNGSRAGKDREPFIQVFHNDSNSKVQTAYRVVGTYLLASSVTAAEEESNGDLRILRKALKKSTMDRELKKDKSHLNSQGQRADEVQCCQADVGVKCQTHDGGDVPCSSSTCKGSGKLVSSHVVPLEGARELQTDRHVFKPPAPVKHRVRTETKWEDDEDVLSELLEEEINKMSKPETSPLSRCPGCILLFAEATSRTFSALLCSSLHMCDMHRALQEATDRYRARHTDVQTRGRRERRQPTGTESQRNAGHWRDFCLTPIHKGEKQRPVKHQLKKYNDFSLTPVHGRSPVRRFTSHDREGLTPRKQHCSSEDERTIREDGEGNQLKMRLNSKLSSISPQQQRRRGRRDFNREEVDFLVKGVKRFGPRWNSILWSYPFKDGRTNVDLAKKYKRLMKAEALDVGRI